MTAENDGLPLTDAVADEPDETEPVAGDGTTDPPTDPLRLDRPAEPPRPQGPGTDMHGSMEGDLFDGDPDR